MKRLALVLALCLSGAASAGPLSDPIMAEGVFADAGAGEVLQYSLSSNGPGDAAPALSALRLLVMDDNGTKFLLLDQEAGGTRSEIARFPAASANPLLLYFLENIVRDMSQATGGNPFYIRNRIRAALIAAEAAPGADGRITVTLEPFAADPNRDRLGPFAGLRLQVSFDPAEPGRLLSLKADTGAGPGGYSEEMILTGGE